MKTLKLVLLRHGQTDHNFTLRLTGWADPELDELGRQQATQAADHLFHNFMIEAIYTTPLNRAWQTAAPLANLTGLVPIQHAGLKELNFGEVEGMSIPDAKVKHAEQFAQWRTNDDPHFAWPGGETRMVFHTRVDQAIWEIILANAGKHETVAVVAHGGSLAGFVCELQTGSPYAWRQFLLRNCEYYVVEVHYEDLPVTRQNCKLQVVHVGELLPISAEG